MSSANILGYWTSKIVTAKRKSKCKESSCVGFTEQGYILKGEMCIEFHNCYGLGKYSRNFRVCLKCAEDVLKHQINPYKETLEKLSKLQPKNNVLELKPKEHFDFCADDLPF